MGRPEGRPYRYVVSGFSRTCVVRLQADTTTEPNNQTVPFKEQAMAKSATVGNQRAILANQRQIIANQRKLDRILANQARILANQKKILAKSRG